MVASLFIGGCTAKTELKATLETSIDSLVGNWIYYRYDGKQSYTNQTFHLILKKTKQNSVFTRKNPRNMILLIGKFKNN